MSVNVCRRHIMRASKAQTITSRLKGAGDCVMHVHMCYDDGCYYGLDQIASDVTITVDATRRVQTSRPRRLLSEVSSVLHQSFVQEVPGYFLRKFIYFHRAIYVDPQV